MSLATIRTARTGGLASTLYNTGFDIIYDFRFLLTRNKCGELELTGIDDDHALLCDDVRHQCTRASGNHRSGHSLATHKLGEYWWRMLTVFLYEFGWVKSFFSRIRCILESWTISFIAKIHWNKITKNQLAWFEHANIYFKFVTKQSNWVE